MEYTVYRQIPKGSNFPQLDMPWQLIGTFESEKDLRHITLNDALHTIKEPRRRGAWYQVLPIERTGAKPEKY